MGMMEVRQLAEEGGRGEVRVCRGGGEGVREVAYDSRRAGPGTLFFALAGAKSDGAAFAEDAVRRGAVGVAHGGAAWEESRMGRLREVAGGREVAELTCENPRRAMGLLADVLEGRPSRKVRVYGVTGTNGKTTTTYLLRGLLRGAGRRAGLLGTVAYDVGDGTEREAGRTMPESADTHRLLAEALGNGVEDMAMEVSSQGLAAERAAGVRFAVLGFTQLTGDHLDFHGTMERYFAEKRRLFMEVGADAPAVVNGRCAWGRRLLAELRGAGRTAGRFGSEDEEAEVSAWGVRGEAEGSSFVLRTPAGEVGEVRLGLPGRYNVENLLLAVGLGLLGGADLQAMARVIPDLQGAPGRMQRVPDPLGTRRCLVDYAHTDDALKNVLRTVRESTAGRLWVVFGCGGDRDAGKRPRMGAVAARLADVAVVTSDNPRGEEPGRIIEEIVAGMEGTERRADVVVEADRGRAIALAVQGMAPGDTLVVAGKGHEKGQLAKGMLTPFDDVEEVGKALRASAQRSEKWGARK